MRALLEETFRGLRAVVIGGDYQPAVWMRALLGVLGAQTAQVSGSALLSADALCGVLTHERPQLVIWASRPPQDKRMDTAEWVRCAQTLVTESREAGVRLIVRCSDAWVYSASPPAFPPDQTDATGGRNVSGLCESLVQQVLLAASRALMGDPVSAVCARHLPLLYGAASDDPLDEWMRRLRLNEPLHLGGSGCAAVFMHPLNAYAGALSAAAMVLRHGDAYTGAWNFSAPPECVLSRRGAVRVLRRTLKSDSAITEDALPLCPYPAMLCDRPARERLGWHVVWDAEEALERYCAYRPGCEEKQAERFMERMDEMER
ncbi:hypothetical protein [Beduinella massiliensis]|uniref:hypothetical protein n=1 Tax=Beduinella massiliensis TaxID=1852363 RepID=UPI000C82FF3C